MTKTIGKSLPYYIEQAIISYGEIAIEKLSKHKGNKSKLEFLAQEINAPIRDCDEVVSYLESKGYVKLNVTSKCAEVVLTEKGKQYCKSRGDYSSFNLSNFFYNLISPFWKVFG